MKLSKKTLFSLASLLTIALFPLNKGRQEVAAAPKIYRSIASSDEHEAQKETSKKKEEECLIQKSISSLQDSIQKSIKDKNEIISEIKKFEDEIASSQQESRTTRENKEKKSHSIIPVTQMGWAALWKNINLLQYQQSQLQRLTFHNILKDMGPINTTPSYFERSLLYQQEGGINHYGVGGYSRPFYTLPTYQNLIPDLAFEYRPSFPFDIPEY